MSNTTMVHVRLDEGLKTQAAEALAAMGLSISDAVRVFLTRVVAEQQLPFSLRVPNAETRAALQEAHEMMARPGRFSHSKELLDALEEEAGPK